MRVKQDNRITKAFRILDYLKKNSDESHPVSHKELKDNIPGLDDNHTLNKLLIDLTYSLNTDSKGNDLKERDNWPIKFNSLDELYKESGKNNSHLEYGNRIQNIFYNHLFDNNELDLLFEAVNSCQTLSQNEKNNLSAKIKYNLASKYYEPNIFKGTYTPEIYDRKTIRKNARLLSYAIKNGFEISYIFYGYPVNKKQERVYSTRRYISPYYLVSNNGKDYLIHGRHENKETKVGILRLDLMHDIKVCDGKRKRLYIKATPKEEVRNLPLEWTDDFHLSHLYMSYEEPVEVKIKLTKPSTSRKSGDYYLFLHDSFGYNYEIEKEIDGCPVISVNCSPWSMKQWALQYSEHVEVLEPEYLRNEIKEIIKELNKKYEI